MIYVLLEMTDDCISNILSLSTSKKFSLAKFSEYKQIRDSECEIYGLSYKNYELREYPNDWEITDCIEYNVIDKTKEDES